MCRYEGVAWIRARLPSLPMPCRILIVEDNDALRDMFRETLLHRGFEVLVASTSTDALEISAEYTADAVLTDLDIPGVSGLELCRTLADRNAVFGQKPLVWLMTGSHDPELSSQAIAVGACGVLRKPFSVQTVCNAIEQLLGNREPFAVG